MAISMQLISRFRWTLAVNGSEMSHDGGTKPSRRSPKDKLITIRIIRACPGPFQAKGSHPQECRMRPPERA
ncbi:hypothetical protein TWF281_009582 [Arthrobotrys megalospora]